MTGVTEAGSTPILDRLVALEQIRVLKARYCRYVDTKDWDGFASLFTDEALLCFPENDPDWVPIATFLGAVDSALKGGITVHHVYSPENEIISEAEATAIWAMQDRLFFPPGVFGIANASRIVGAGHYHETYRRIDHRWLIDRVRLTQLHLATELQPRSVI